MGLGEILEDGLYDFKNSLGGGVIYRFSSGGVLEEVARFFDVIYVVGRVCIMLQ